MSGAPAGATIFALSSGAPPAAIAVVRISGAQAGPALVAIAGRLPAPRRTTLAALRDRSGELLDRALCLWFPGPRTATGEDLAELHLHGGRAVIAAVLGELAALPDCRLAEPGEFTRRAFANGRLDLFEAEGLADLLAAETEGERRRALHAAEGGLSRSIEGWRSALLAIAARIEAEIEFGDDGDDVSPDPRLADDLAALRDEMKTALASPPAERLRDGVRVVLCGPPNSGKSSLINALAGRPVAIASPEPGTTRDLVEAPLILGGIALILIDSAGLRRADDAIEQEGVTRAMAAIASADLLLWLGDPASCPDQARSLVIAAKADILQRDAAATVDVLVSAHDGTGMEALRRLLVQRAAGLLPATSAGWTLRHREGIAQIDRELAGVEPADPLLAAEHVRAAMRHCDRLMGRTGVEDMLDALFSRFCVGK